MSDLRELARIKSDLAGFEAAIDAETPYQHELDPMIRGTWCHDLRIVFDALAEREAALEAAESALAEAVKALEKLLMVCLPPHDVSGTRMFDDARAVLYSLRSYPAVQRSVERVRALVEAARLAERHFARTNSSEATWQALRAALRACEEQR